jgi:hypothetical protein
MRRTVAAMSPGFFDDKRSVWLALQRGERGVRPEAVQLEEVSVAEERQDAHGSNPAGAPG